MLAGNVARSVPLPLLIAFALSGCRSGERKPPARGPVEVSVVTLKAQPVTTDAELTGRTNATAVAQVRPQVDGIVRERLFKEGSYIHAGQQLYQIDPRLYTASRDQAAAQLANAQAALISAQSKIARYSRLTDIDAVSRQDVDDARSAAGQAAANVRQYRATLRSAQVNVGFTRVFAPISGRIGRSLYTRGALVTAAQTDPLATIQQLDPIYVDIQQSADALLNLRESLAKGNVLPASATVKLVLGNGRPYAQTGTVEFGEVSVDENSGTVTLRARFPNPDGILLPGMFVRVIVPQTVVEQGILAPQQGISRDPKGNATALVVDAASKVQQRAVTTAQAVGDKWLVTSGLKAGDRLIVEGVDKAQPGSVVKPVAMGAR